MDDRLAFMFHSRDTIERQSARAPERQSARAPERQSARAPERQSARAPERQSARAPERQSARAPERQSARAPERQSARAPERQSARAPERQSARAPERQSWFLRPRLADLPLACPGRGSVPCIRSAGGVLVPARRLPCDGSMRGRFPPVRTKARRTRRRTIPPDSGTSRSTPCAVCPAHQSSRLHVVGRALNDNLLRPLTSRFR